MCHVGKRCTPMVFVLLLTLGVLFFGTPVLVSADDIVISEGSSSDLTVQSDLGDGLLLDTMVKMLQRGASIDCSISESGTFSQFLTSLRDDIVYTIMDYTGIDEVSWLSFNNSLNPLDWEITDSWEITRSGTGLADKYLNNRRLRFAQENSEVPVSPDPDYLSYLLKMNTNQGRDSFYWGNRSNISDLGGGSKLEALTYPFTSYSYFPVTNYSDLSNPYAIISSGSYQNVYVTNLLDLNIFSNGSSYSFALSFSRLSPVGRQNWGSYTPLYSFEFFYEDYGDYVFNGSTTSNSNPVNFTCSYTGSLADVLSFASDRFRNVNVYVDGVPWYIVGTNAPIDIPIGDSTYLTDTNTPVYYTFPEPAYFDYQTLYNLLETLYNNHQVIKWQDIQDVITDVNGVPVVSTVQIYRTDYDVLADEQLRFVPVFYNNQDMTEPIENGVNIINIGASVIPDDLLVVFIWCGSVLIFALVVRRLLE